MNTGVDVPAPPAPAPAVGFSRAATTGDTVTIACKLPHGVILRTFIWTEENEPMRDGTIKPTRRSRPSGESFVARGTWTGSAGQAYNKANPAVAELLPGGYALTHGCPKGLWELWLEQNKTSKLVRNKIVFAFADHGTTSKEAGKMSDVKSGLEPLNPDRPAERLPGGVDRRLRIGILERGEGQS